MTLRQIIRPGSIAFCLVCHDDMLLPIAHSKRCKIRETFFQSNLSFLLHTLFPCIVIIPLKLCASVFLPSFLSQLENSRWFRLFFHSIFSSNNYLFKLWLLPHLSISFLFYRFYSHCDFHSICTPSLHSFASDRGLILPLNPFNQTFFSFLFYPFTFSPSTPPPSSSPPPSSPDHV